MIPLLLRLYAEFFCVGLFSVGGGLATVPFLSDLGMRTGWFTAADLVNMIAISESTPGPIGVNMATYVGFTTAGPIGAIIAPIGLATPAFFVILIISRVLRRFRENKHLEDFFYGLRPASVGLIGSVCLSVCMTALFSFQGGTFTIDWKSVVVFIIIFLALCIPKVKNLHAIVFLLFSGIVGVVFQMAV